MAAQRTGGKTQRAAHQHARRVAALDLAKWINLDLGCKWAHGCVITNTRGHVVRWVPFSSLYSALHVLLRSDVTICSHWHQTTPLPPTSPPPPASERFQIFPAPFLEKHPNLPHPAQKPVRSIYIYSLALPFVSIRGMISDRPVIWLMKRICFFFKKGEEERREMKGSLISQLGLISSKEGSAPHTPLFLSLSFLSPRSLLVLTI